MPTASAVNSDSRASRAPSGRWSASTPTSTDAEARADAGATAGSATAAGNLARSRSVVLRRPGVTRSTITPGYARYVLALLFVAYVFNFIDRQILAILLQPIKEELQVSDSAMGLLTGITFALFFTCASIPIARLADRRSRRTIIAVGLTAWSALTAASGLA